MKKPSGQHLPLPKEHRDLKGRISGADGMTLSEFNLRDPRNQFGDLIRVSEDGRNKSVMTGIQTTEDHADLVVMFPVTPEAKTFSLYDSMGTLLKTVDLSKAENRADWNCTADYGITRNTEPSKKPETTKAPVSFAVVIFAITAGAGGALLQNARKNNSSTFSSAPENRPPCQKLSTLT
jgi:hypothetical protein